MLTLRTSGIALFAPPANRELWACWNLLPRFGCLWCIIGMESNHWL